MFGRNRIPDAFDREARILGEIKNTAYLSATRQLKDYIEWSRINNYAFTLYVREGATVSDPLQLLMKQNGFVIQRVPMPF